MEDLFWEITGTYDYGLIRENGIWKIAGLTLNFKKENGTRDVLALAGKRASQHPDSYLINALKAKDAVATNENYVIDAHRGWNTKGNKQVDLNWILLYQIVDGKIKRVQNFCGDPYTPDSFFNHK